MVPAVGRNSSELKGKANTGQEAGKRDQTNKSIIAVMAKTWKVGGRAELHHTIRVYFFRLVSF